MEIINESVAKALVINQKHQALILTVGNYRARPDKSFKPDLPGGLVSDSETELTAVVRELQEETSIIADPSAFTLAFAKTEFFDKESKSVTKFLYILQLNDTPEVTLSWEHVEYEWMSIDLLPAIELRPFYKEAIDYCFAHTLII